MKKLINMPDIKIGIIGVSRDCFQIELTRSRLKRVVAECRKLKLNIAVCETIIESESDAIVAAAEMEQQHVDAAAIYLGNFGPEGPMTVFAKHLNKPFMLCGAAEESKKTMIGGRGDAFCGMLNASINVGLRNLTAHVPEYPVGLPKEIAQMVAHFVDVARVIVGVQSLKVFGFGPRPQDFYACNAPIKPMYDLGIEVMENSELDMLMQFKSMKGKKKEIDAIARDMAKELGVGNKQPQKLKQLAQFELALMKFFEDNLHSCQYGVFANKCWPSFEPAFGFVPCYVNSRLASRGIPVACEVDLYGAVSEYMAQLASQSTATILDVNNTVPADIKIKNLKGASRQDLFMGFHCGNTPTCMLRPGFSMKYQLIMHRLMESGKTPDITAGTLEGTIKPGKATIFRLQSTADCHLMSYLAEGAVLNANPHSFGGIGIIGIKDFGRFYRHVLIQKQFPHHTAMVLKPAGKVLYDALAVLGVEDVNTPLPKNVPYPTENPFR